MGKNINGSNSDMADDQVAVMKKLGIYNSELYVYEGLGHGAFEEAKDFYERIFAFC